MFQNGLAVLKPPHWFLTTSTSIIVFKYIMLIVTFIYLFGVLRRFQQCTGHITTGSWKDRGNRIYS